MKNIPKQKHYKKDSFSCQKHVAQVEQMMMMINYILSIELYF
jgi:hypothetical protein